MHDDIDYQELINLIHTLAEESITPSNTNCIAPIPGFLFTINAQVDEESSDEESSDEESFDEESSDDSTQSKHWVHALLNVQIWLGLDGNISMDTDPYDAIKEIFGQLSSEHIDGLIVSDEHIPTQKGLDLLESRLSVASDFKEEFITLCDSIDKREASILWQEQWDNFQIQDFSEPISAIVDTWKFSQFLSLLDADELVINPSYQRDDVWSVGDARDLIKSILRGIPLPAIILYEQEEEDNGNYKNIYQIVDGKQRLTSILRFMGKHPYVTEYVKQCDTQYPTPSDGIKPSVLFATNPSKFMTRYVKNNPHMSDALKTRFKKYAPFKLPKFRAKALKNFSNKFYVEVKGLRTPNNDTLENIFTRPNPKYKLPVILFEKTSIRDIHDVFGIYNKKGKTLNADEVRNAVFHHLHLAKLMLILSGDRLDQLEELAGYLPNTLTAPGLHGVSSKLDLVDHYLQSMGFGVSRFKRTKILSWITAMLHESPPQKNASEYSTPATAKHIDKMFKAVNDNPSHPLSKITYLTSFAETLIKAILLHKDLTASWSIDFKSKRKNNSWEELPVVASLVFCVLMVMMGEEARVKTTITVDSSETLIGPESTQNETQWGHIAMCIVHFLDEMDYTEHSDKEAQLRSKLNTTAKTDVLPALRSIAKRYQSQT